MKEELTCINTLRQYPKRLIADVSVRTNENVSLIIMLEYGNKKNEFNVGQ
jgi:hypothetical protein